MEERGMFRPTSAAPGTKAKVEEMRHREERGLPLWHADDVVDEKSATITRPEKTSFDPGESMRESRPPPTDDGRVIRKKIGNH